MRASFAALIAIVISCPAAGQSHLPQAVADVDQLLRQLWAEQGVAPSVDCGDELFLRRVTLDLAGRPPTLDELQQFLKQPDRAAVVRRLLESPEFSSFWAASLTTQWCGHQNLIAADREVLRNWLEGELSRNVPYDRLAHSVITAEGESALDGPVNFLLRHREQPATKLARIFLGVRLDCAQCHDHPFDRWTQDDHDQMQRFFSGMQSREVAQGNIRLFSGVDQGMGPRFLTGAQARSRRWRDEFSLFTTRSKPFARTFANRVWYQLLGRGIVHPIDDFHRENPPVSKELLERLAEFARTSDFDIRDMCELICNSTAYQRSSRLADRSAPITPQQLATFAVRTVKPLTLRQHLQSLETVRGRPLAPADRERLRRASIAGGLDEDFSRPWEHHETAQAVMARLTFQDPWRPSRLDAPPSFTDMFRRTLSRSPTPAERKRLEALSLDELGFILLHCDEFCLNH